MNDVNFLQARIRELVEEYETLHACEVSSVWIEHYDAHPRTVEVTVTTREKVKAA